MACLPCPGTAEILPLYLSPYPYPFPCLACRLPLPAPPAPALASVLLPALMLTHGVPALLTERPVRRSDRPS